MVEPLLSTRSLFKQKTCSEIAVIGKMKDACNIYLEDLDQDWQFVPGKQKNIGNQEVEDGSSWSARSSHIVVEPLLSTRSVFKQKTCSEIAVIGKMKDACNIYLEDLDQDWQFVPESRRILGIRKSRMDQVGQLGVPTSWLSPYYQREVYSSRRPVLRLLW